MLTCSLLRRRQTGVRRGQSHSSLTQDPVAGRLPSNPILFPPSQHSLVPGVVLRTGAEFCMCRESWEVPGGPLAGSIPWLFACLWCGHARANSRPNSTFLLSAHHPSPPSSPFNKSFISQHFISIWKKRVKHSQPSNLWLRVALLRYPGI
uniref:Uncharacterized protein n=1 Tax=Pipistrellus kuhlii TaxID=59472 RepID=A0A7J7ZJX9_PIPKU|nr:hypothetical protein mPipKuh1_009479 [Pipistrellus kuhlii]